MTSPDAALIRNWNAVVGENDDVWHLGDFMSAKAGDCAQVLAALNDHKHLIVANSDPETTTASKGWTSVEHYAELREGGHLLILCHYPLRTWNRWTKGRSTCTAILTAG